MSEHESNASPVRPSGGPCACGTFPVLPPPMRGRICLAHEPDALHTVRACLAWDASLDPAESDAPIPGTVTPRGEAPHACPDVTDAACAYLGDPAGYYHAHVVRLSL